MPEIPLYAQGLPPKTGAVPDMPLDRESRGRVNLSGVSSAARERGRAAAEAALANRTPLLPENMYSGLERGQHQLAAGVEHLGGVMGVIAVRQQEAANYLDVSKAEDAMQEAYAAHLAERPKLDPREWESDLQSRLQSLPALWQGDKKISPAAQDRIGTIFDHFAKMRMSETGLQKTGAIASNVRAVGFARAESAAERGDMPGVVGALSEVSAVSAAHQGEVTAKAIELQDKVRAANIDNFIATNPRLAIDALNKPDAERPEELKGLSPALEQRARNKAFTADYTAKNQVLSLFSTDFEDGKILNAGQLDQWRSRNDPRQVLGKGEVAAMVRKLAGDTPTQEAYNADDTAIRKIDWANETPYKLPETLARINAAYSGPFRDKLLKLANDGYSAASGGAGPDPVLNMMNDTLAKLHAGEMFGVAWKDQATRSQHLYDAFKDVDKLKAIGVPESYIPILSGKDASGKPTGKPALEGPMAVKVFRAAMASASDADKRTGTSSIKPELYNKLTPYTQQLFAKAATEGGFVDESLREKSAALEAQYKLQAEKWRREHPNATPQEAAQFISGITKTPISAGAAMDIAPANEAGMSSALIPMTAPTREQYDAFLQRFKK